MTTILCSVVDDGSMPTTTQCKTSPTTLGRTNYVSRTRHESRCGICSHPHRRAIENAFLRRTSTVSDISRRYGVGHDGIYRHARATGLLDKWKASRRNGNESDSVAEENRGITVGKTLFHAEVEATSYARAMIELLQIPADDQVLTAIEGAIQAKAQAENLDLDVAANSLFNEAALMKIAGGPHSWLEWFSRLHVRH